MAHIHRDGEEGETVNIDDPQRLPSPCLASRVDQARGQHGRRVRMRILLALAVSLGILLTPALTPAREVSNEVWAALDRHDFASAERLARADVANAPDRVEPHLALAHVYVEWSREVGDAKRSKQAIEVLDETSRGCL
jgi:hypothetical protein